MFGPKVRPQPKPSLLHRMLTNWPLRKYLGFYAFTPVFFCFGALVEYLMINMNINNVNFYKVYSDKYAKNMAQKQLEQKLNIESIIESEKEKLRERLNQNKDQKS